MKSKILPATLAAVLQCAIGLALADPDEETVVEAGSDEVTILQELTGLAPNPERSVDEYEALYVQGFAELKDFIGTNVSSRRNEAQKQLREMAFHVSSPDREAQRKVFCSAVAKQLEIPDYPQTGRRLLIEALGDLGGAQSVPPLVKLLSSPIANDVERGRMALQNIPAVEADRALVDALKTATENKNLTLGLIDSIAARQYTAAVEEIAPLLSNPDTDIVIAAATALGRLGGSDATRALGKARSGTTDKRLRREFELGLLAIANQRGISGDRPGAGKIFKVLHAQTESVAVKRAAMLGMARAIPAESGAVVIDALRSKDPRTRTAGIVTSVLVSNRQLTTGLASMLETSPKQVQKQILNALAMKGDLAAQPNVVKLLLSIGELERRDRVKAKDLEIACIRALGPLGSVSVVELLLSKAITPDSQIRDAAMSALSQVKGNAIAQTIEFHAREGKTSEIRAIAIGLFMRNRDRTGLTRIMDFASEDDLAVSSAALSVLRQQAGDTEFRKLLDLYAKKRGGVLVVLTAVCARARNPSLVSSEIISFMREHEEPGQHRQLIALFPILGSSNGLAAVEALIGKGKIHSDIAIAALAKWPDATALPEMLQIMKSENKDPVVTGQMAKGVAKLVASSTELSLEQRVRYAADAFEIATASRERILLLPILGQLPHDRSIDLVESMLTDRQIGAHAASAAVNLCEKLVEKDPEAARALATKLTKSKFNSRIKSRAEIVLAQIGSKKGDGKEREEPIFE
ncbi:MAG: HEAT repeat protein [Verrucomicrobiales bacterium]|jgi:HEAT repeat protein